MKYVLCILLGLCAGCGNPAPEVGRTYGPMVRTDGVVKVYYPGPPVSVAVIKTSLGTFDVTDPDAMTDVRLKAGTKVSMHVAPCYEFTFLHGGKLHSVSYGNYEVLQITALK